MLKIVALLLIIPCFLIAQNKITVTGIVKNGETQEPVAGVSIYANKKVIGVTANDGTFSIKVNEDAAITFTDVRYSNYNLKLKPGQTTVQVLMKVRDDKMSEVVVTGYAKKARELTTGSTVVITAKDIRDVPSANVMDLLQGKVAGLNINTSSGAPGSTGSIYLRGLSNPSFSGAGADAALTPTSPLFVVDGVPIDVNSTYEYGFNSGGPGINPVSLIPQEDIEQIEILKDAQATTLYGSRGAYGVILITTKRGKSKVPIVNFRTNQFLSTVPNLRKVIGGKDERMMRLSEVLQFDPNFQHALTTIDQTPALTDSLNAYYNNSTNWQDVFYKSTWNQTYNVGVSGGDQAFNYKTNIGYFNQKGIIKNTGFSRYNVDMNMQYQPIEKFKLSTTISAAMGENKKGSGNGIMQTGVAGSVNTSSLLPAPGAFGANSADLAQLAVIDNNKAAQLNTNFEMQYEFVRGLRATNTFSYNYMSGTENTFTPAIMNGNMSKSYAYNDLTGTLYNRFMLNYAKTFERGHSINLYGFSEISSKKYKVDVIQQTGTPSDGISGPLGAATSLGGTLSNTETRDVSYAGNVSYDYNKKYVLNAGAMWSKSSISGPNMPWAFNPTVGLRWNFSKEKLFEHLTFLDYGSFRLGWGKSSIPVGTIYDTYGKYLNGTTTYNSSPIINIDWSSAPNVNLIPATKTDLNFGTELGLFKQRLQFVFEAYYKQNDNNLYVKNLSSMNAFSQVSTNELGLVNYGYELTVTAKPLSASSKVSWTVTANAALDHEVLTRLPGEAKQMVVVDPNTGLGTMYRVGRNSLSNVMYNTKGVYASTADVPVDPATGLRMHTGAPGNPIYFQQGDARWTDVNGDYVVNQNDYIVCGNAMPLVVGGFSSYTNYKNFTLNVSTSFKYKRDIINAAAAQAFQRFYNPAALNQMLPIDQFNYWAPSNTKGVVYPNPYDYTRSGDYSATSIGNGSYLPFRADQTLFLEDGSYFKINSIAFSYNFNRNKTKKYGITSARLTFTMNNVYTFTKYTGPNPENVTDMGYDRSDGYPQSKNYSLGLDLQF
ncbi:SusC/RagA family TonB-linked outer membrane protein [Chitinophagaceae bacterium 26-R-25]|nr:SusC/RagA family TonB-linked outer membrane protein [Chitinophagaceae bacterium 26-R-25]